MHRPRIHKRVMVNNRDCPLVPLIHIGDIRHTVVVHVRHLRDIHARIGDVNVLNVSWTGTVPGHEHFSRC